MSFPGHESGRHGASLRLNSGTYTPVANLGSLTPYSFARKFSSYNQKLQRLYEEIAYTLLAGGHVECRFELRDTGIVVFPGPNETIGDADFRRLLQKYPSVVISHNRTSVFVGYPETWETLFARLLPHLRFTNGLTTSLFLLLGAAAVFSLLFYWVRMFV